MSSAWSSTSHFSAMNSHQMASHDQQMPSHDQQMPSHDHQMQSAATAQLSSHCIAMGHSQKSSDTASVSCHFTDVAEVQVTQQHCQDCSASLCQSLFAWLSPTLAVIPLSDSAEIPSRLALAYQAQHLAGFWQEILRPPKA